jgi:tetratricopeptide (TPR) repeat protein
MACALARRQSKRWKLGSLLALTLLSTGVAQAAPGRSLLVIPASSHWVQTPVAEAVSDALPDRLQQAGYEAVVVRPNSPVVELALREGWLPASTAPRRSLEENRYLLALLAKTEAVLTAQVSGTEAESALEVELAGTIAQRPVTLRVSAAAQSDPIKVGRELAEKAAAAVTAEVWGQLGTDEQGRKQGAAERYAAGQATSDLRAAAVQFELAIAGDDTKAEYFLAGAEARMRLGQSEAALTRVKRAVELAPNDYDLRARAAQVALNGERPEQALPWFLEAAEARPEDPILLEGVAAAARERGDRALATEYYRRAIARYPQLANEPSALPAIMAALPDNGLPLSGVIPENLMLQAARIYFRSGEHTQGARALMAWLQGGARPPVADDEYLLWAQGLDEEMERVAREVEEALQAVQGNPTDDPEAEALVDELHNRSERLADLGELISVSDFMNAAHRFRVLAYHTLNESNFEALTYLRTNDQAHRRRSALLRDAARKAVGEARDLQK